MSQIVLSSLLIALALTLFTNAAEPSSAQWRFVAVRDETAPRSSVKDDAGKQVLAIQGNGEAISDGRWVKRIELPQSSHVILTAQYRASNIEMTARNVIASIVWLDENGNPTGDPEFADTTGAADAKGWRKVWAIVPVPKKAKQAEIQLRLRWSAKGEVEWRDAELKASAPPTPRMVKVASVNHRPRGNKTAQENLDGFAKLIDEAGAKKADIVCLPEAITLIGRGSDYLANAESIPGPSTDFLGKVAAKNHAYIVAGLLERDGKAAYNTAVLIDRDGKLAGKYRKICLPTSEYNGGLAPGCEYPIFETDFGKIGIMICWDVAYPEIARELASRGAEMILMPIWGGNETLVKARAIENQVPLVISSYDLRSAIYDQAGEAKAIAADTSSTVVYADLNLAEPMHWPWTGNWHSRIPLEGPAKLEVSKAEISSK